MGFEYVRSALPVANRLRGMFEAGEYADRNQTNRYVKDVCDSEWPDSSEVYSTKFGRSIGVERAAFPLVDEYIKPLVGWTGELTLRAYRMQSGDYLRAHTDDYFGGQRSFVYYVTRRWKWDWGGLFVTADKVVMPGFNDLIILDTKTPHCVSEVMPWAREPIYLLAGFPA